MNTKVLPKGVWPVMLTPFDESGAIDWPAYDELIEFYIEQGSAGLFADCLSGEISELSADECVELAVRAVRQAAGRVPVVAGAICPGSVDKIAAHAVRISESGVVAVVVAPNQFASEAEDESVLRERLFDFTERVDASILLGIYECPYPYHRHVSASLLKEVAQTGRFLFMKDTCANPEVIRGKIKAVQGTSMRVFNAHALSLIQSVQMGAAGYSGVGTNFFGGPYRCACFQKQRSAEELTAADELMKQVQQAIRESGAYPAFPKYFLNSQGLKILPHCRVEYQQSGDWSQLSDSLVQQKDFFDKAAAEPTSC